MPPHTTNTPMHTQNAQRKCLPGKKKMDFSLSTILQRCRMAVHLLCQTSWIFSFYREEVSHRSRSVNAPCRSQRVCPLRIGHRTRESGAFASCFRRDRDGYFGLLSILVPTRQADRALCRQPSRAAPGRAADRLHRSVPTPWQNGPHYER